MRDLKSTENNRLTIADPVGGSDVVLHYRLPTTDERVRYQSAQVRREGKKIIFTGAAARLEFGAKILTGFRDGDFGFDGRPISCDPESKNYRNDWRDLVQQTAGDLLEVLALTVFEGVRVVPQEEAEVETESIDAVPLATSSGDCATTARRSRKRSAPATPGRT